MVESSERTSTRRESAAASDPNGSAGASAEGAGPAATRRLEGEHAASRSRTAGIGQGRRDAMIPQDKLPLRLTIRRWTARAYRLSLFPGRHSGGIFVTGSCYRRLGYPSQADS